MSLDINLTNVQAEPIVVSTNTTATNDSVYTVVANATFTDPSPVEGKGFKVFVRNGTAIIGGTSYGANSLVFRIFHSGAWANTLINVDLSGYVPTSRTINGLDLTTNRTLTASDVGAPSGSGTSINSNTGDETKASIESKLGLFHIDIPASATLTLTTTPTQLAKIEIPANSINSQDALRIYSPLVKSGGAGTIVFNYKLSTSATMPSGTTDRIATFTCASNTTWLPMQRNPIYSGGNLIGFLASVNSVNDLAVGLNAPSIIAIDRTVTQYLYIEATLGNSGDSVYLAGGHITNM